MPDDILTDSPAQPEPSGLSEGPGAQAPDAAASPPTVSETPETPDPYAGIDALDADELVKRHPKLAGRIGTLAQKQAAALAETLATQKAHDLALQSEQQEVNQMLSQADDAFKRRDFETHDRLKAAALEKQDALRARTADTQHATLATQATLDGIDAYLNHQFSQLPKAVQEQIAGKSFEGTNPMHARALYIETLTEAVGTYREQQGYAKGEKAGFEAGQKAALGETNGSVRIDTGSGRPAGPLTLDRYLNMTSEERRALSPAEINAITAGAS